MRLDSVVIFPGNDTASFVGSSGNRLIPIREARAFDEFAAALGRSMTAEIRIDEGPELPPPSEGVIYLCRPDVLDRSVARQTDRVHSLSSRTVLVDMVRTYALDQAERLSLAAVIDTGQYLRWQNGGGSGRPVELFGLKGVGRTVGATWPDVPRLEGQNYALLRDSQNRELPAFLAAYLEAYAPLL
jgi:hypothetical protein